MTYKITDLYKYTNMASKLFSICISVPICQAEPDRALRDNSVGR